VVGAVCGVVDALGEAGWEAWDEWAPYALRKVELNLILLGQIRSFNRCLQSGSQQHVLLYHFVGEGLVTELEEEWLEEAAAVLVDLPEMGVVVPGECVPIPDGCPDQVGVRDVLIIGYVFREGEVEDVGLLGCCCVLVVVSGEWEEGSDLVPSCAEVTYSIAIESTEVAAHERQSKELVLVNTFD